MTAKSPKPAATPKYKAGQQHALTFVKVEFRQRTFEETFRGYGLTEEPGKLTDKETGKKPKGEPIKAKWLYVFEFGQGGNKLVYGDQPQSDEPPLSLMGGVPHMAFLARTKLPTERVNFYSDPANSVDLIGRSEVFDPKDHASDPVVLLEFLGMTERLADAYATTCHRVQQLFSLPKVQLAHLAASAAKLNRDFAEALASDFPALAAFEVKAKREQYSLQEDAIRKQKALRDIKNTPGYCHSMADLVADESTVDDALKAWDASTSEEETFYFASLANPDPKKEGLQDWYDQLQRVRPVSQMFAGGGLHSAGRKMLIARFFKLETQLQAPKGSPGRYAKALEAFAEEVEKIFSDNPQMLRGMEKENGKLFFLNESKSGLEYKWSASPVEGMTQVKSTEVFAKKSLSKMYALEKGALGVCAAVEIVNTVLSFAILQEAQEKGTADGAAYFAFANDSASGLGAVAAFGAVLAKGETTTAALGAEAAGKVVKGLGVAGAGFGVVSSAIGVGLAVKGYADADTEIEKYKQVSVGFANAAAVLVGGLQVAAAWGVEGALVGAAAGPFGVLALFVAGATVAYCTWYFSDRIERWPKDYFKDAGKKSIDWTDLYSKECDGDAIKCIEQGAEHLLSLMHPYEGSCWVDRWIRPTISGLGSMGGGDVSETATLEIKVGAWLQEKSKILVSNLKTDPPSYMLPPSLELTAANWSKVQDTIVFSVPLTRDVADRAYDYSMDVVIDLRGDGASRTKAKSCKGELRVKEHHLS